MKIKIIKETMRKGHPPMVLNEENIEKVDKFECLGNGISYNDNLKSTIKQRLQTEMETNQNTYPLCRHQEKNAEGHSHSSGDTRSRKLTLRWLNKTETTKRIFTIS